MQLFIMRDDTGWHGWSYAYVEFVLNSGQGFRVNLYSNQADVLWRVFVKGKRIHGDVSKPFVRLNSEETELFINLYRSKLITKRKIWMELKKMKREQIIEKLKEVLPCLLLAEKIKGRQSTEMT